ncbi:murein hydrolase activator EnvC family protein [Anaeromicropila herbilytica]|uniref:Uncharacterized protein n=1 Tax=Anaeromicropila herbilytica TaxID=2785025 RepID=A0A7R7IG26_9FIRM|nr:M23 family metallopeptidase [Anaeromicropila herbilytica]BCN32648.1 hypothetical protein bsdtb5_39430 [Anaeromicropila herbilytica]
MKTWTRRILSIVIIAVTLSSFTFTSYANSIQDAKDQKAALEKKKKNTEEKIAQLEKEKGDIVTYIHKLDTQMNELNGEIDNLNSQISTVNVNLVETRKELEEAKKTEQKQYLTMKKRIKYMYENGNQDYLEVLLNSEDIADLLNRAEYVSKISEYDSNLLNDYKATKKSIATKETDLKTNLTKLQGLTEEAEYEKSTVKKLADTQAVELAKYNANISKSKDVVENYDNEIDKQENVIEDLVQEEIRRAEAARKAEEARKAEAERKAREQQAANNSSNNNSADNDSDSSSNVTPSATGFIWPVPSSSRITSSFGYRAQPTAGASTYHKGIDIGAPTGSNIVASNSGTVLIATYSGSAGNYVMISHGSGIYTVYMHASQLLVSVGQSVSKGQVIAKVGSTGYSTGSHLHFGISVNGTYVNPLNYVSP